MEEMGSNFKAWFPHTVEIRYSVSKYEVLNFDTIHSIYTTLEKPTVN